MYILSFTSIVSMPPSDYVCDTIYWRVLPLDS